MSNKKESYFEKLSKKITKAEETTNKKSIAYLNKEIDFIKHFVSNNSDIIDIGSGSGLVVNRLYKYVNNIIAVEPFSGLSKFIIDSPNVLVLNADLLSFNIRKKFDFVICTGVSQFFTKSNISIIYSNIFSMLKNDGSLIMRSHCGLHEDIIINKFSEELNAEYYAEYRQVDSEVELLKQIGFKKVEIFDEVSSELNVWENTKHFYFVCEK